MSLIDGNFALITSSTRNVGGIIPDCTIEERHSDRLTITDHPVETGAAITDHAFRNPSVLSMRIGFSNSTAKTYGWDQEAYQLLLSLQQSRQPFSVSTGKRLYNNMLVGEIEVSNDQETEYALICTVELREIIIVGTQQVTNGIGAPTNQASPQDTQAPAASGNVQPQAAPGAPLELHPGLQ